MALGPCSFLEILKGGRCWPTVHPWCWLHRRSKATMQRRTATIPLLSDQWERSYLPPSALASGPNGVADRQNQERIGPCCTQESRPVVPHPPNNKYSAAGFFRKTGRLEKNRWYSSASKT